jgi:AcrR family transcriptional regulator
MTEPDGTFQKRRNRNYEDTHRVLISKAVELISESGAEAVSVSALARATRINRSTVYYHFDSREALIAAVRQWSSEELAKGVNPGAASNSRIDHITSFVLRNPEIIKLWIDDFIAVGNIRERFPQWDHLVASLREAFGTHAGHADGAGRRADGIDTGECDVEVYCLLMLTGAFIAPRVFKNSVRPDESIERIIQRFTAEQQRILQREGMQAIWSAVDGTEIPKRGVGAGPIEKAF